MDGKNKENADNFQEDLDTDTYDFKGADGVERDKRGELLILLPDCGISIARRQGISVAPGAGKEDGRPESIEKGSQFSGILRDDKGMIPVGKMETKGLVAEVHDSEKPGEAGVVDYGQTEILVPIKPGEGSAPTIRDFDLDFNLPGKKTADRKLPKPSPPDREEAAQEPRKIKTSPLWMPPKETEPVLPPIQEVKDEAVKKVIPFEEPEFPDNGPAVIIKDTQRKKEPVPDIKDKPAAPPIKAHSYLDDEPVVQKTAPPAAEKRTRKKMKLPKAVREKQTSLALVLLMILLFAILACVLAVQHVPEARKYYDSVLANFFKTKKQPAAPTYGQPETNMFEVTIGGRKVLLRDGTDYKAVRSYTDRLGEIYRIGRDAASAKEPK